MATMTIREKQDAALAYWEAGRTHISPQEAAPILGCTPYSLNLSAKAHFLADSAYYFAGGSCKISVHWIMQQLGVGKKSSRRRSIVIPGAGIKYHNHSTTKTEEAQVPC